MATACRTWQCCATSRRCSGRWPRLRPPGGCWTAPPATLTGWPAAGRPGAARGRARAAGGDPDVELLIIDADATLVLAQTDAKQGTVGTNKGSFGFAPLLAYLDRGPAPGEPLAGLLRPGNAAAGASSDLIELVNLALAQLPIDERPVLVRSDSAGGSSKLAWHLRERGIGFTPGDADRRSICARRSQPSPSAWTSTVEPDG